LPGKETYDAATSLLVSHFILDRQARIAFFAHIANRLNPGGLLASADIASPHPIDDSASVFDLWIRAMRYTGMTEEKAAGYREKLDAGVSILSPRDIAQLHIEAGFANSRLISQSLLMHGWIAQMPA
tara:strand:- start:3970 stop:4350 length:381 start_codon:yes stop_codon:yes gene_type:complete